MFSYTSSSSCHTIQCWACASPVRDGEQRAYTARTRECVTREQQLASPKPGVELHSIITYELYNDAHETVSGYVYRATPPANSQQPTANFQEIYQLPAQFTITIQPLMIRPDNNSEFRQWNMCAGRKQVVSQ